MPLPPDLLRVVSSPGGGQLALVIGAGCSVEQPTGLPLSRQVSQEIHQSLLNDGVLNPGDCSDPDDLSVVADAVYAKTNSQGDVVERFRTRYDLRTPSANEGYKIAAALLREGAISSVVTLNFDLALSNAVAEVGVGSAVGIIDGPEGLGAQKATNIFYLHRNVNALDLEAWVLRTATLATEWQGHWEPIIASRVLTAPVVVFAGLGTPVAVLIESAKLLRNALPGARFFQADPGDRVNSRFFAELGLNDADYIQCGWGDLMNQLAHRVSQEHIDELGRAVTRVVAENGLQAEDVTSLLARLLDLGLLKIGRVRACWLLHDKSYCPAETAGFPLLADLLLALGLLARVSGASAILAEDGLIEFHRDDRVVSVFMVASGQGYRNRAALEARMGAHRTQHRLRVKAPTGALIGGTSDGIGELPTPPANIIDGEGGSDSVVTGSSAFKVFHIAEIRANQALAQQIAP